MREPGPTAEGATRQREPRERCEADPSLDHGWVRELSQGAGHYAPAPTVSSALHLGALGFGCAFGFMLIAWRQPRQLLGMQGCL